MTNPSLETRHDRTTRTAVPRARLGGLLVIALLAPFGMGARGCDDAVVGADCNKKGAPKCTCEYYGTGYLAGDSFPDADGCNTCSCQKDRSIVCTEKACAP